MVEQAVSIRVTSQKKYVLLAMSFAVAFAGFVFFTQSMRSDAPDHGDWWSDTIQIIAARNFTTYGFSDLSFGASRDNGPEVGLPPAYYSPWPSAPAALLGLMYDWGLSTAEARVLPLLISSSALIALYLLVIRVIGDWRAGIVASLALAASAPFRLLSDSFAYPSYDLALKTWTMLFITLGGLATGWRRLGWLLAAGIGAFAAIGLSGFEMVPVIVAYSFLFPLFLGAPTSTSLRRFGRALLSSFLVGIGLLSGLLFLIAHNALLLGGREPAIDDLAAWLGSAASSGFTLTWYGQYFTIFTNDYLMYYSLMLVDRLVAYFPVHLVATVLFLCLSGFLMSIVDDDLNWRPLKWLEIIFVSEIIWFVIFRQYSNEHVHTISQLSLSMSLAVAISIITVWRLTNRWLPGKMGIALVGMLLFLGSLADVGVKPHGNLQLQIDWTQQRQQVESIASLTPPNAVIVMALGNHDPTWQLFIGRTFVRRPGVESLDDSLGRPWFLITEAIPGNPVYRNAMDSSRLIRKTQDFVLFDMNPGPLPSSPITGRPGAP